MVWLKLTILVALLACATTISCQESNPYRLSTNHIPKLYTLRMNLDPESTGFKGEVQINFLTKNYTTYIQLNADPNHITINEVHLNAAHTCNVSNVDENTQIANISCPLGIQPNENNQILLKFSGVFRSSIYGLYKARYIENNVTQHYIATQFESIFARRAFPCFDEPQLKAEFDIEIVHPNDYTAKSNSPVSFSKVYEP